MKTSVKYFNEIEKKYGLYKDCISGINYWVYSRFDIWNYILSIQDKNIGKTQNQPSGILSKIKAAMKILFNLVFGNRIRNKDVDVVFLVHERKVKVNGVYECKYTEALKKFCEKYYVFERPYEMGHLKPTDTKNLIYLDGIAIKGNMNYYIVRYLCGKRYKQLVTKVEHRLMRPLKELENAYQISIDTKHVAQMITKRILICRGKYKAYEKVFSKIHPKLIIELVHYNMDSMIINEIAKREGIRTVELQHGNIYDSHISYQYNSDEEIKQLPDEIWLLSDYWKPVIHMPIDEQYLIPVGFPYFESRIEEYKKKYEKQPGKKTVLFISQGTIGKQLSEFAAAFAEQCENGTYRILYKLHPGEISIWKEQYIALKMTKNIEVIESRGIDLYQLFAQSDVQVGVYSTALYEGIGFGLDTYICDMPYAEEMNKLYQSDYASLVHTPQELLDCINSKSRKEEKGKDFWTPDSLNNIKRQMNRIL